MTKEDGHDVVAQKGVDIEACRLQPEGRKRPTELDSFKVKVHMMQLVNDVIKQNVLINAAYENSGRRHVLNWCAESGLIISRIQLETVLLNLPGLITVHKCRQSPLGLADIPDPTDTSEEARIDKEWRTEGDEQDSDDGLTDAIESAIQRYEQLSSPIAE